MTIQGWDEKYQKILAEFRYSRQQDEDSALLLDSIIKNGTPTRMLKSMIAKKPVFVIGAGPSITRALQILKKHKKVIKIAADSTVKLLLKNKIYPDVVVTDLDGDEKSLRIVSQKSIMVVHAHGDNMEKIYMAENFPKCIGTTQSRPIGGLENFGGFTDGDRAIFLASHFDAGKIILLGMDFGNKIGRYSKTRGSDRLLKLKKLRKAQHLTSWLAGKNPRIVSTTRINGVAKITYKDIDSIIT